MEIYALGCCFAHVLYLHDTVGSKIVTDYDHCVCRGTVVDTQLLTKAFIGISSVASTVRSAITNSYPRRQVSQVLHT